MACDGTYCANQCLCNSDCNNHNIGCPTNYTAITPVVVAEIIEPTKIVSIRTEINEQRLRWNTYSGTAFTQINWNDINNHPEVQDTDRNTERSALQDLGFVYGADEADGETNLAQDVNDIIDSLNDARRSCVCNTNCDAYSECVCHNDCGCNYASWLG